jgi:hypothetical protein
MMIKKKKEEEEEEKVVHSIAQYTMSSLLADLVTSTGYVQKSMFFKYQ